VEVGGGFFSKLCPCDNLQLGGTHAQTGLPSSPIPMGPRAHACKHNSTMVSVVCLENGAPRASHRAASTLPRHAPRARRHPRAPVLQPLAEAARTCRRSDTRSLPSQSGLLFWAHVTLQVPSKTLSIFHQHTTTRHTTNTQHTTTTHDTQHTTTLQSTAGNASVQLSIRVPGALSRLLRFLLVRRREMPCRPEQRTGRSMRGCPVGTYNEGAPSCKPCGFKTAATKTGMGMCCIIGSRTAFRKDLRPARNSCLKCPFGKTNATPGGACEGCAVGTYNDKEGAPSCKQCGINTAATKTGMGMCCPIGSRTAFRKDIRGPDRYSCLKCPVGKFTATPGGACEVCVTGASGACEVPSVPTPTVEDKCDDFNGCTTDETVNTGVTCGKDGTSATSCTAAQCCEAKEVQWLYGAWSACSQSCGDGGKQTRFVRVCGFVDGSGVSSKDSMCSHLNQETTKDCVDNPPCSTGLCSSLSRSATGSCIEEGACVRSGRVFLRNRCPRKQHGENICCLTPTRKMM
jgi:hypothetical protein